MANQRNQTVLLEKILESRIEDMPTGSTASEAFELFSAEQALRDYELAEDEIADGIVGGGQDGGIDSIYTFLEGTLLTEDASVLDDDTAPAEFNRNATLSVVCVQSKNSTGFTEAALVTAKASLEQLLDLAVDNEKLLELYNQRIVSKVDIFKRALTKLASRHPKIYIRFVYATKGDTSSVSRGAKERAKQLKKAMVLTTGAEKADVEFLGATELWHLSSKMPSYTLQLPYQEDFTEGTSHAALVKINDYLSFLREEDGKLRRHIFEMNVRDYQGGVEVNREISRTLLDDSAPEFWWMNNGVTIVCSNVTSVGKVFQIDDVQIVNGLQTSFTLYETLKSIEPTNPVLRRHLLVRLLVTDDVAVRDKIIRATNSQTKVPTASLRATDDLQREIEIYLLQHNWFYDRRKNYYKNMGKPRGRIISIPFLAQAVISVGLNEPNQARARPSTLLKNDLDYKRVFPPDLDVDVYRYCLELQKSVDERLVENGLQIDQRNNLRFHVSTLATIRLMNGPVRHPSQLKSIAAINHLPSDEDIDQALAKSQQLMASFSNISGITDSGQIAKSSDFVEYLRENAL